MLEKDKYPPLLSSVTLPRPTHKGQSRAKGRPPGSSYTDISFFLLKDFSLSIQKLQEWMFFGLWKLLKVTQWAGSSSDTLLLCFPPVAFPGPWTRLSHSVGKWRGSAHPCRRCLWVSNTGFERLAWKTLEKLNMLSVLGHRLAEEMAQSPGAALGKGFFCPHSCLYPYCSSSKQPCDKHDLGL